jgi:hypothetical protein
MSAGDYYEIYNCKFTAERAGYYMVSLASAFTGLSRGCAIRAYVMKNNNYVYFLEDARHTLYNDDATCGIQRQIYLAAGDWIQFRTRQDSGLPQTVYGGERWTSVQIHKMS